METKFSKAFTFTVTNFSQNSSQILSPPFSSYGCEWIVDLTGRYATNYLSLYLAVNEPKSLGLNWKRKANFYFVLLNQSGQETSRTCESGDVLFCASSSGRGWPKAFPLKEVLDQSVLENGRFTIEIYINVLEVVDESIDVNGFKVLSYQASLVKQIFVDHPDIAKDCRSKNQVMKTAYMNVLLSLLETVKKPPKSITETELSKAQNELCELTDVGFELEWLKTKLEEISLANTDAYQIQQLEKQVKNLELNVSGLKTELANEKANFVSLKEAFSNLRVKLEKEKAKSAKALSLKEIWSGLKAKKDHKKGNSAITDNLLSWEDGEDLVSATNCLGIQQKKNGYKSIN